MTRAGASGREYRVAGPYQPSVQMPEALDVGQDVDCTRPGPAAAPIYHRLAALLYAAL
jgi:hypothetical protein